MIRLAITIFVLALLACGGSDTPQTDETAAADGAAATPDAAVAAPAAPAPTGAAPAAPEPAVNPKTASCLALVSQAKFQEALPACLAALQVDPDNTAVQTALATAKAESASAAASGAADAAAGSAAEAANSQVKDLTGGALGGSATE